MLGDRDDDIGTLSIPSFALENRQQKKKKTKIDFLGTTIAATHARSLSLTPSFSSSKEQGRSGGRLEGRGRGHCLRLATRHEHEASLSR